MRSRTILAAALALSTALNAALIGYGYTIYRLRPLALLSDPIPSQMVGVLANRLPGEAGILLRGKLEADRPLLEAERNGYRAALERAAGLIEADTIDMPALKAAINEARGHRGRMGDTYIDAFVEAIATLPVAERRALVERFRKR